ncbi:hypothetical protein [Nocardioides pocheonensis]|nr:hypothetical protein [Nocardioides pocheonensis]
MKSEDYRHLPEPVRPEDMVAEVDTRPVPDPDAGINRDAANALEAGG